MTRTINADLECDSSLHFTTAINKSCTFSLFRWWELLFFLDRTCCCFVYYVTWHTWLNTLLNTISTVFKCPQNIESPSLRASQFLLLVGGSNSPVAGALDRNSVLLFMNNSIIHGAMANHNRTNKPTQRTILKACDHVWSPSPHHKTNLHFHNIIIPLGVPFN